MKRNMAATRRLHIISRTSDSLKQMIGDRNFIAKSWQLIVLVYDNTVNYQTSQKMRMMSFWQNEEHDLNFWHKFQTLSKDTLIFNISKILKNI